MKSYFRPEPNLGRGHSRAPLLPQRADVMSFQKALRSDSDWDDEIVQVAGVLQVVDVHQSWCFGLQAQFESYPPILVFG